MEVRASPSAGPSAVPESGRFPLTRWTLIRRLGDEGPEVVRQALDELCRQYYFPLYSFIRQQGPPHHDAEDILHGFLARFLRTGAFARADPARGRLRTYLAVCLKNYLTDWYRHEARSSTARAKAPAHDLAWPREEAAAALARYTREGPVDCETPERHLDRVWARELISRAITQTGKVYAERGRTALFAALLPALENGGSLRGGQPTVLAASLGMSEGSLRVAMNRLLNCFGARLHEEVARTVTDPSDVAAEIAALRDLFRPVPPVGHP